MFICVYLRPLFCLLAFPLIPHVQPHAEQVRGEIPGVLAQHRAVREHLLRAADVVPVEKAVAPGHAEVVGRAPVQPQSALADQTEVGQTPAGVGPRQRELVRRGREMSWMLSPERNAFRLVMLSASVFSK